MLLSLSACLRCPWSTVVGGAGSGKTYTMGSEAGHFEASTSLEAQGLIPRFLDDLFRFLSAEEREATVSGSGGEAGLLVPERCGLPSSSSHALHLLVPSRLDECRFLPRSPRHSWRSMGRTSSTSSTRREPMTARWVPVHAPGPRLDLTVEQLDCTLGITMTYSADFLLRLR